MRSMGSGTDDISESVENPPVSSTTTPQPTRKLNVRVLGPGLALVDMMAAFRFLLLRGVEPTIDRCRTFEVGDEVSTASLRKAAEQGKLEAQVRQGSMYKNGEGVERDPSQAAEWYRRAAEHGNAPAQHSCFWATCSSGERVSGRTSVKRYHGMKRQLSKETPTRNGSCPLCIRLVQLAE